MGFIDRERRTIWVDMALPFPAWRSTAMHEVVHAINGDDHHDPAAEQRAQRETAQRLIPAAALVVALHVSLDIDDVLDVLNVDAGVLRTRIRNLIPDEASAARKAIANRLPRDLEQDGCAIQRWWRWQRQPAPVPLFDQHPDVVRFGPTRIHVPVAAEQAAAT